ncbi:hypothetical protein, partial [Legionella sp.]|uniref:hypothetical protein n=1 Tax=Legionella sp. TaxID=459 RepID=UPI003D146D42
DILYLARKCDKERLMQLAKAGFCLGVFSGDYNVVMLLAQEGNTSSVNFLIDVFHASRNYATEGYAMGGHFSQVQQQIALGAAVSSAIIGYAKKGYVQQVNELISEGKYLNAAISGYAFAGNVEQVNRLLDLAASNSMVLSRSIALEYYARGGHYASAQLLLDQGANRNRAVLGYAFSGDIERVKEQLNLGAETRFAIYGFALAGNIERLEQFAAPSRNATDMILGLAYRGEIYSIKNMLKSYKNQYIAIYAYASGGYFSHVNQMIQRVGRDGIQLACDGYKDGGYLGAQNLLYLLSITRENYLRSALFQAAQSGLDMKKMLRKAEKINLLMEKHQLTFNEACGYLAVATNIFLFQGQQLVMSNKLSADSYFYILSFITGLTEPGTRAIFRVANVRVTDRVLKTSHGLFSFFLSRDTLDKTDEHIVARRTKRLEAVGISHETLRSQN